MSQVARIPGGRSAKVPLYGELTEVGLKRLVSRFSIRFKDLLKDILRRYSASLWKETVADRPASLSLIFVTILTTPDGGIKTRDIIRR